MTRIEFDKLDILEQVDYINNMLESTSLTKLCDNIDINRKTIRERFNKVGYAYNKDLNKYVVTQGTTEVIITTTNPGNTSQPKAPKKTNNTNTKDDKYKALENKIKDLQKQIDIINNKLNDNEVVIQVVTQETTNSIIHKDIDSSRNKQTTNRSYRLYKDIQEDFATFCKANKQHKVQDILSSAIKEYLDKYNK